METQTFQETHYNNIENIVNVFFRDIVCFENFDFKDSINNKSKNKKQLIKDIIDLCEGFNEIFNSSIRANNSETIDFLSSNDFQFIPKGAFSTKEREEFIKSICIFYHIWITGQNLSNLIKMTITECIKWCQISSSPEEIYILYLILFQSSLMCIEVYFKFKKEKMEKSFYNSILKLKKKKKVLTQENSEKISSKLVKTFKKYININHL